MANNEMNTEYFSGSQASIFLGDIWIDDIVDWQCSVGAQATPLYGYGQTFYSHAAQGRVLVQGSFTINFREPNYIFAAIARYNRNNPGDKNLDLRRHGDPFAKDNTSQSPTYEELRESIDTFFAKKRSETDDIAGPVSSTILERSRLQTLDGTELSNDFAIPTFDIKIGYGAVLGPDTIGEKIVGIKLVGKGKAIMANGEAIKETYNFFARNVI